MLPTFTAEESLRKLRNDHNRYKLSLKICEIKGIVPQSIGGYCYTDIPCHQTPFGGKLRESVVSGNYRAVHFAVILLAVSAYILRSLMKGFKSY